MKKLSSFIILILSLGLGGVVGYLGGHIGMSYIKSTLSSLDICLLIILVIIAYFLQIIIHEGGHLLFGILNGYKFISYRIGSLMIVKENNRIQLKKFSLTGTVGQCLLSPPDYNNGNYPQALYNLGGSLLNILLSIISLTIYFIVKDIHFMSLAILFFGLFGIYLGCINGIPLKINGMNNDGYNAFYCHRDAYTKKVFWIILKTNALSTQGQRLKDMDSSYFQDVSPQVIQNTLASSLILLNLNCAMDKKDFTQAKEIIQIIKDNSIDFISIHQQLIKNDEFYLSLISNDFNDIHLYTNKVFQKFLKSMKNYPAVIRTQYTYELLYKNNVHLAQTYLDQFQKIKKNYPNKMDIESEQELMDYADSIYQSTRISNT